MSSNLWRFFFQNIFYHPLDCGKFNLLSPIQVLMCLFSFEFSVKPKSQFGHLWGRSPVCINICLLRLPLLANVFPGQKGQEALPALEVQIWTWNNSSFFFVITQIYFVKCFLSQFWVDASFLQLNYCQNTLVKNKRKCPKSKFIFGKQDTIA